MMYLFLFILSSQPVPPTPKMGGAPPPPVGDVSIDAYIWVLVFFALCYGVVASMRNRKSSL